MGYTNYYWMTPEAKKILNDSEFGFVDVCTEIANNYNKMVGVRDRVHVETPSGLVSPIYVVPNDHNDEWLRIDPEDKEGFCKTRGKKYDAVVKAILMAGVDSGVFSRWDCDGLRDDVLPMYDMACKLVEKSGLEVVEPVEEGEEAKVALARYLGVPASKIVDSDEYSYFEPDHEYAVDVNGETQIYCVYDNLDSAREAAVDDLEEKFQDTPEILAAAIEYFGNTALSFFSSDSKQDEEIRNLHDEMNSEEFAKNVANMYVDGDLVPFDFRGFAEHNIENLGIEWHLAVYDGKEIDLGDGMLAYREE